MPPNFGGISLLQTIQLVVLALEILDIRLDGQPAAGDALDQFGRGVLASVAVDVLNEPVVQSLEFSLPHFVWDFGMRLERRVVEQRAHHVAEGVALERAADDPDVPMHVLEDAVAVVGRDDSEVRLEAFMPGFGQVADGESPLQQLQFEVEAQHHVQVISHLVGVGADERLLHLVDGAVEFVERDALELVGELRLEFGIEILPRLAAAPDDVFPQPRLTLVDACARPTRQRGPLVDGIVALFVHGVPRFVDVAEQRLAEEILLDARGDADVADGERGHKGMVGLVHAAALKIVAELADDVFAEFKLLRFGIMLAQAGIVRGRLRRDGFDDGDELGAQLREQRADGGGLHPVVGEVNERVGDVLVAGEEVGEAAAEVESPLEVRADAGEVVGGTRLGPELVRLRAVDVEFGEEIGRDFEGAFVVAPRHTEEGGVVRVVGQAFFVGTEVVEQFADLFVGEFFLRHFRERRHLTSAGGRTADGHVGGLVPAEDGCGLVEVAGFGEQGFELGKFLFWFHGSLGEMIWKGRMFLFYRSKSDWQPDPSRCYNWADEQGRDPFPFAGPLEGRGGDRAAGAARHDAGRALEKIERGGALCH